MGVLLPGMRSGADGVRGMGKPKNWHSVGRFFRVALVILCWTVSATAASTPDTPVSETAALADRILDGGGYQRALPDIPKPPNWSFRTPEWFAEIVRYALWIVVAAVIAFIAHFLFQEFGGGFHPRAVDPETRERRAVLRSSGAAKINADSARDLLREADALAERGAFAEAIHLILLRGIEDVRNSLSEGLRPSLTTREIVERSKLEKRTAEAFRFIASAAELCHFGGRSATQRLYGECREVYARLAFGEEPAR